MSVAPKRPCFHCRSIVEALERQLAEAEETRTCNIYNEYCRDHDFVHGAEAEELREGIEKLIASDIRGRDMRAALQRLLDRVDARDSLAYREATDEEEDDEDDVPVNGTTTGEEQGR